MPKNTTILLIRHAEKPDSAPDIDTDTYAEADKCPDPGPDPGLKDPEGVARAQAYVSFFQNYPLKPGVQLPCVPSVPKEPIELNYLFAAKDSCKSHRPRLTIEPLAAALKLDIDLKHKDADYLQVAQDILTKDKYNDSNVLICWHHGKIMSLAYALLTGFSPCAWPAPHWPSEVFGWVVQIRFDKNGTIDQSQTFCLNEKLMPDDTINPPGGGTTEATAGQPQPPA